MEAFNQHLSAQPFAARFVEMVICLTLFTAMVSAKLHTHIFVVCLPTTNILHVNVYYILVKKGAILRDIFLVLFDCFMDALHGRSVNNIDTHIVNSFTLISLGNYF